MRVTQSMLSSNMLRNLNTSYGKMSKLQDQMTSGKKVNRPSDDPVVVVKGMNYRVEVDKVEQYQRNVSTAHTWLDTTDEALDQVGTALHRVKELTVQAANDTNTPEEREKIAAEIAQIKEQMRDISNTKVGDKYIFSGAHTNEPLYKANNATPPVVEANAAVTATGGQRDFKLNVFDGISLNVNTSGKELFGQIDTFLADLSDLLENGGSGKEIGDKLGDGGTTELSGLTEMVLVKRADIGARQNRLEMMENRLDIQFVNVTKQMSENEDTDYTEAITQMATTESIHQASLSIGAKIVQQTLVDFIR
ncbi:MAG: flagellar hook-associated protein FlgL [Solibacillus sp.]